MYGSGYSVVSKHGLQAQRKYRSKGKSCGYYMRIVFFFSSLIQSLIIVSLVLFLIYGKNYDSASSDRIQHLEEMHSRLSIENVALRQQRKNLTNLLNTTLTEKTHNDWDLMRCRYLSNVSLGYIQNLDRDLQKCNRELSMLQIKQQFPLQCQGPPFTRLTNEGGCNCGLQTERLKAQIDLLNSNFTQSTEIMRINEERLSTERDNLRLETIQLRRDKSLHEKTLEYSKLQCKEEFVHSLSGISNVTRTFLQKMETFFVKPIFHITCPKHREYLEETRFNCTSLSRDIEDKFQHYLNNVGDQVAKIQMDNSHLKAENERLSSDYRVCAQNRLRIIKEHQTNMEKAQLKYDLEKEELILQKRKLTGEKEVLENSVKFKETEVKHLKEQINLLNSTCKTGGLFGGTRTGSPWNSGGGSTVPGIGLGSNSRLGSTGTGVNRLGSTGLGSTGIGSTGSNSNFGSNGFGSNRQATTGLGSSIFGSTGSGLNKQSSTGLGSTGLGSTGSGSNYGSTGSGLNKQSSTGLGSSSYGSTGSSSNYGSTGSGLNKQSSTGLGSSSYGSNHGSTGSGLNTKQSTGFGSTGSNSNFGSTGSGLNKQSSTGSGSLGYGSTGSGSNFGSTGFNRQGSTGLGTGSSTSSGTSLNKQTSNGRSLSPFGSSGSTSSQSSTGSVSSKDTGSSSSSKSSGSGLSWFGFGSSSSNPGQSKPSSGSGTGTGTGTGRGSSSGSPFGTGRTSGFGGSSVSQHLADLQRIINPSAPREKQELSHMLG